MKDKLISFDTAKLAKEAGFDEAVLNHYALENTYSSSYETFQDDVKNSEIEPLEYSAPTQSLLQKWLRENSGIHVEVLFDHCGTKKYDYMLCRTKPDLHADSDKDYSTYELALESGLNEALKLV